MERFTAKRKNQAGGKLYIMRCHLTMCEQKSDLSKKYYRHRGIAAVWTALVITTIFLLVGLSLDVAKLALNIHQMQNAVDASVLAGAQIVKKSLPIDTQQFTHDLAYVNMADHLWVTLRMKEQFDPLTEDPDTYDILIGRWVRYNRTFVPTLDAPNAVQAIARRNKKFNTTEPALRAIQYVFGPLVDVPDANAATLAVGWCYDSGGAGLICLDPYAEPGLYIGGTSQLDIDGGGIHVNAEFRNDNPQDSKNATDLQGGGQGFPEVDAGFLNVVGEIAPEPYSPDWENIFGVAQDGGIVEGEYGFSVSDESTIPSPTYLPDPLAANMVDNPYVTYNPDKLPEEVWDQLKPELIGTTIPTITQTLDGQTVPTNEPIGFSCTLGPGYYPYGLSISNGVDISLQPSSDSGLGTIFVFGGTGGSPKAGLVMNGGSLTGEGVTCYVTRNYSSSDPYEFGEITITGGALNLWSPGDWTNKQNIEDGGQFDGSLVTGLNGIAVWQDPMMVYQQGGTLVHPDVHLNGNGEFTISGTLYFPDPIHARLEGDLGQAGNQILCGSAELYGGAEITVNYDGRNRGESRRVCLAK